ncbi:hypothetical protein FNI18_02740 [Salmonella enterica subsp. salamae]|nr:hypothetical protein [Salmonella enterica subsp. salamae]
MRIELRKPELNDAALVQNSAMGAFFLWLFCRYYQHYKKECPTLTITFLVLPLILHKSTVKLICSTQKASGIHLFAGKIQKKREAIFTIHERTLQLRSLTFDSLSIAEVAGLLEIDTKTATLIVRCDDSELDLPLLSDDLKKIHACCDKLAYWFAEVSEQQIAKTLMVDF